MSFVIPVALAGPELVEAGVLILAPLVLALHDLAGNLLGA